jgi:hypothetical protein
MRPRAGFFSGILSLLLVVAGAAQARAAVGSWATGVDVKGRLAAPVSLSWNRVPLARALATLATTQRVAIVLDRRIDPGQPITLALNDEPFADALRRVASHLGAGYCQLGAVAYIGPASMSARLRTLSALRWDEARGLPAERAQKFLAMRSWKWDEPAEPALLARDLAAEAGVTLAGDAAIPHDLWPGADWPPLSWLDRLTLLAAQFDLTFRMAAGGHRVELVAAPSDVRVVRNYAAGRDAKAIVKRWAQDLRDADIKLAGDKICVTARVEDHELIERRLRGKPLTPTAVTLGPECYQLSIEKAVLLKVVEELAGRLNLTIRWDRAAIETAGLSAEQLVTVQVQDADLDELLGAVLTGTGLTFQRQDRAVTIRPLAGAGRGEPQNP